MAQQMLTNLEGSVANMRQGLETELTPLCRDLQIHKSAPTEASLQEYANAFEQWRRGAVHPSLVSTIYIWQPEANHSSNLYRLDSDAGKFVHADWPSDLAPIRLQIQQMSLAFDRAAIDVDHAPPNHGPNFGPPPPEFRHPEHGAFHGDHSAREMPPHFPDDDSSSGWMIEQNVPALVHLIFTSGTNNNGAKNKQQNARAAWIVVPLNTETLRDHIFSRAGAALFRERGSFGLRNCCHSTK